MKTNKIAFQTDQGASTAALPEVAVPRLQASPQDIAVLAYQFYESDGCPDGCAEVHWYAAERLLQQQCGKK